MNPTGPRVLKLLTKEGKAPIAIAINAGRDNAPAIGTYKIGSASILLSIPEIEIEELSLQLFDIVEVEICEQWHMSWPDEGVNTKGNKNNEA